MEKAKKVRKYCTTTGYGNFSHLSKWDSARNCFCYISLVRKVEKVMVVIGLVIGNTIIVGVHMWTVHILVTILP